MGPARHPGHCLLPVHAEDHPPAYLQGEDCQWAGQAQPWWRSEDLGAHGSGVLGSLRRWLPQACTLLLLVLFIYDIFFVFITPFLTKVGPLCPSQLPAPLLLPG